MKKKILAIVLCVAMLAIAIVGGTMAYFTDTKSATNTMAVGKVEITQHEVVSEDPIMPLADTIGHELNNKVVTIENTGSVDCYFRTLFAFEDGADHAASDWMHMGTDLDEVKDFKYPGLNITVDGIEYEVLYAIYPSALEAGKTSEKVLHSVWADAVKHDNAWRESVGDQYNVIVLTQAVQADGWAEGTTPEQALNTAFPGITDTATVQGWFAP